MTPGSGIGDDAIYSSVANYTKLIVKKGDVVFQLVIYGGFPIAKKGTWRRLSPRKSSPSSDAPRRMFGLPL